MCVCVCCFTSLSPIVQLYHVVVVVVVVTVAAVAVAVAVDAVVR